MGTGRRAHNPERRLRIESELMKTEEGEAERLKLQKLGLMPGDALRLQELEVGLASQRLWKLPAFPRW